MRPAALVVALAVACSSPPPALVGDDLDGMRSMIAVVERGDAVTATAHPLGGDAAGLSLDVGEADHLTVLLYTMPLDALGLSAAKLPLATTGRALPPHARAYSLELAGDAWRELDPLPTRLSDLRIETPPSPCTLPETREFDTTATSTSNSIVFMVPGPPGTAVLATQEGDLFTLDAMRITPVRTSTALSPGAGWFDPGTRTLWVSSGFRLVTIDLDSGGARTVAQLPGFVEHMVGPIDADAPFELFMATQGGDVLHFDSSGLHTLGRIPGSRDNRLLLASPGRGWATVAKAQLYELTSSTVRSGAKPIDDVDCELNAFDPNYVPKVTLATRWRDRVALVRLCRLGNTDTQVLLRNDADDGWVIAASGALIEEEVRAAAPLFDGLVLFGADSHVTRLLGDGTFCRTELYGYTAADQTPQNFEHVVALDARTFAVTGGTVRADLTKPPRVVVMRFP